MTSVGEDEEKSEPPCAAGGSGECCSHFGKQLGAVLKMVTLKLPCDSAIPLLGIGPKEMKMCDHTEVFP